MRRVVFVSPESTVAHKLRDPLKQQTRQLKVELFGLSGYRIRAAEAAWG